MNARSPRSPIPGRGASTNPNSRFERIEVKPDYELLDTDQGEPKERPKTVFYRDRSRSIITHNNSPDIGFEASINPYRGCEHGCAYCYARPTHEYLGFSAGLDFESKVMLKEDAPELLRKELSSPRWEPKTLSLSGVTDPYQSVERELRITRRLLEVLAEFKNPVAVVTKNDLVTRDVDLFEELARHDAVSVAVSLTTLDDDLRRVMEPRTSTPKRRLAAIRTLAEAGIPVGVMTAPVIPGLTDHELPALLKAAAEAGASYAAYTVVRLPGAVKVVFTKWLGHHRPERKEKVLSRLRQMHGGDLNDPRFGKRMHGEGVWARQIEQLFTLGCRRAGLDAGCFPKLSTEAFCVPSDGTSHVQPPLFVNVLHDR